MVALPSFLAFHQLAQVGKENRRLRQEVADPVAEVKLEQWLKTCCGHGAAPAMVLSRAVSVRVDLGRIGGGKDTFRAWHELMTIKTSRSVRLQAAERGRGTVKLDNFCLWSVGLCSERGGKERLSRQFAFKLQTRQLCHGIYFHSEPQQGRGRGKLWQQDVQKVPVSNMQNCSPRISLQWGHIVVKWIVK